MKIDLELIASETLALLKKEGKELVSKNSLSSTRAIGDAVQEYIATIGLPKALNKCHIKTDIDNVFTRRSMEDMAFTDSDGYYFAIDCKTHNLNSICRI